MEQIHQRLRAYQQRRAKLEEEWPSQLIQRLRQYYLINKYPLKEEFTPLIIEHPLDKYSKDSVFYYIDLQSWFIYEREIESQIRSLEYESRRIAA